jgi:hypothetical protein
VPENDKRDNKSLPFRRDFIYRFHDSQTLIFHPPHERNLRAEETIMHAQALLIIHVEMTPGLDIRVAPE